MSNEQQSPSTSTPPPPTKRAKLYDVGPAKNREKWYLNSTTADVYFTFASTDLDSTSSTRVPAQKALLACDSEVFEAMFYGPLKESGDIHLSDVSEAAFKEFLQFFYLIKVKLSIENLADVMYLGHKYDFINCIDVCLQFFKDEHSADNILIGLSMAILYDHSDEIL